MLSLLKDILLGTEDAYARALATAEEHISTSGGDWYGVGAKGSFLLLMGSAASTAEQGTPYSRAGNTLLATALKAANGSDSYEAHLLHYLAGCAFAADGFYDKAAAQFAFSDMGRAGLEDWCADWCQILMSSAAQAAGDPAKSKDHFTKVSEGDPKAAALMFEAWATRKL